MSFTGKGQTLNAFAAEVGPCITNVDYSDAINKIITECNKTGRATATDGIKTTTGTVNLDIDADDDVFLNQWVPGATIDDWEHQPSPGVGNFEVVSTNVLIESRDFGVPTNGKVAVTASLHFNNFTIQAIAA